jgi:hypothetical protein
VIESRTAWRWRRAAARPAIIDSQSVRAAEIVRRHSRGWDAGKKVNGRKRHIAVDVQGLLLAILVPPASTQDRALSPTHPTHHTAFAN